MVFNFTCRQSSALPHSSSLQRFLSVKLIMQPLIRPKSAVDPRGPASYKTSSKVAHRENGRICLAHLHLKCFFELRLSLKRNLEGSSHSYFFLCLPK